MSRRLMIICRKCNPDGDSDPFLEMRDGTIICPRCEDELYLPGDPVWDEFGAENWGGDPKGKLAQALEKAREKAKKVGKTLKIEKLGAEFDRGIQDKDGKIYSGEKDRIRKYFKNWKPKSYPYEKRIVSETKSKWCENCGELDEDDEDNWNYYQFFLKQKNSSRPTMRYLTGGYCNDCGSDLCQNCSDGQTSGQFNPLFEPNCDECGYSFCKSCKDEDEDRCNTCQEEYEENVCDCCGYLHHAEGIGQWEIGEQLSQEGNYGEGRDFNAGGWGGMNLTVPLDEMKEMVRKKRAESFSATKGIDTFTEPFDELSLDSGNIKKVIVGIGIGVAGILAYNKWK